MEHISKTRIRKVDVRNLSYLSRHFIGLHKQISQIEIRMTDLIITQDIFNLS